MLRLSDIRGHDGIVQRLQAAAVSSTAAQAYLFYGPEGVGKFAAAKAFARALNCRGNDSARSEGMDRRAPSGLDCGVCSSCSRIDKGSHPDIHIIDEGYTGEIKIDDVRLLQQEIALRPYEARFKVFIINDAHNLNPVAGNALLKTLEETPGKSIIILVTDKPRMLLATIVSRCRRENFRPLGREQFAGELSSMGFDSAAGHYLAHFCEGRLGPATRLKGSDVLGEKNRIIDRFLSGRLEAGESKREDLRRELVVMAAWFRDVYITKLGIDSAINADRKRELEQSASRYGFDDVERILGAISSSFLYLEQNVNIKLLLANLQSTLHG
ncbi:MAG: ATP-binding protein [Deltaproteobacteria bacterium]